MNRSPDTEATESLSVRIEPHGPAAERTIAQLQARGVAARDDACEPGRPAATARCATGAETIDALVAAATASLDEVDLHLSVDRR